MITRAKARRLKVLSHKHQKLYLGTVESSDFTSFKGQKEINKIRHSPELLLKRDFAFLWYFYLRPVQTLITFTFCRPYSLHFTDRRRGLEKVTV